MIFSQRIVNKERERERERGRQEQRQRERGREREKEREKEREMRRTGHRTLPYKARRQKLAFSLPRGRRIVVKRKWKYMKERQLDKVTREEEEAR